MFNISTKKTKSFKCVDNFGEEGYIVAVIDCPDFLEKLSLVLQGIFSCKVEGEDLKIGLPDISITSKDATDVEKIVPVHKLIESHIFDFVSFLACMKKVGMIQKFSDHSRNIDDILKIDASLKRASFDNNQSGHFFIAYQLSPVFDDCILEVSEKDASDLLKVTIYHRDQNSLIAFLHHLYQNISSLILLPEEFATNLHSASFEECKETLKNSILKEISSAKEFEKRLNIDEEELKKFKFQLKDLEYATDMAYVKLRIASDQEEENE
ncbi:hypothetical protein HHI36_001408 [Cryptolaemus montrouzieri]|uniref:Uncharacterized protein n=1 Tax=Cryptolaemus montrouzieri TaxID=559131 RepID=A0ABD2P7I8_9CUCU